MKKLAIICLPGLDSFIRDIARELGSGYEVRLCVTNRAADIKAAVEWAEIVWLEWANESAIEAMKHVNGKPVVVRLHSYEALSGYLPAIPWERVSRLVLVAPHMADVCEMMLPGITGRVDTVVIPNGVDIDNIPFTERKHGFNIAWVCDISHKKGPQLLPQVLHALVSTDKRYHLHVAGAFQEPRYEIYLKHMLHEMGLDDNVTFYGHLDTAGMEEFWAKQNYLLSCSPHEGHPYNVMEAMARGIKPVIHNFYGAEKLYQKKWLWNTTNEAVTIIESGIAPHESMECLKNVVRSGWTLTDQVESILNLLGEI
ncbi:MAG: glycosyltransferase family 4 protein [Bacteroidales bacterium]|nr:glycosyltransferase family 4 protein [Bacteroidales bacterium]